MFLGLLSFLPLLQRRSRFPLKWKIDAQNWDSPSTSTYTRTHFSIPADPRCGQHEAVCFLMFTWEDERCSVESESTEFPVFVCSSAPVPEGGVHVWLLPPSPLTL